MLSNMRRSGSSIFIYAIFGILIAMFVINFRPGGTHNGQDSGCSGNSNAAMSVNGDDVNMSSFRLTASRVRGGKGNDRTMAAFEALIMRELLAQEANARGIVVSDTLIDDEIKHGYFFVGGQRILYSDLFDRHDDGSMTWNVDKFKNLVDSTNLRSIGAFRDEQQRELAASLMAEILKNEVNVSREEAHQAWLHAETAVTYDAVAFNPEDYRAAMKASDAELAAKYLAAHPDEVKARFTADEKQYDNVPTQLQVREIFIAKAEPPAPAPAPTSGSADGSGAATDGAAGSAAPGATAGSGSAAGGSTVKVEAKPAKPAKPDPKASKPDAKSDGGMPIEVAKAKLEAVRAEIASGKKQFGDAAKELTSDSLGKLNAGLLDWRVADNLALGDKTVSDAAKALKPGELSPVITTDRGAYLVKVEGTRSGKLTFDQVKDEIAAKLAREAYPIEAAHRAAIAALTTAHAGSGAVLEQQYGPGGPGEPSSTLIELIQDPSIPKSERDKIGLRWQAAQEKAAGLHGSLEQTWTTDVPTGWFAIADSAVSPAAGSAPAPAGSGSATAAAGSGSATAAAGSGSATAAPVDLMQPSKDELPAFGPVTPKVVRNSFAPRGKDLPSLSGSTAAVTALFDELVPGDLAKTIYSVGGNFVVVQLLDRTRPDETEFEKIADQWVDALRGQRSQEALYDWLRARCNASTKANRITWAHDLLRDSDAQGNPLPETYRPCQSLTGRPAGQAGQAGQAGAEPGGE